VAEQKPGFFKRIFSFALGKRAAPPAGEPPESAQHAVADSAPLPEEPAALPESAVLAEPPPTPEAIKASPEPITEPTDKAAITAPVRDIRRRPKPAPKAKATADKAPPQPEQPVEPGPAATKRPKPDAKPAPKAKAKAKRAPPQKFATPAAPKKSPPPAAARLPEAKREEAKPAAAEPDLAPELLQSGTAGQAPLAQASREIERPAPGGKLRILEPRPKTAAPEPAAEKAGWFNRLRKGLSRSSQALTGNIAAVLTKRRLDDETLQQLEDVLVQADLGIETAMRITESLSAQRYGRDVSEEEVREVMASEIAKVLGPVAVPLELELDHRPHVILVVGVNGTGKTTTIGKLAAKLREAGLSTLLVAGDTFRAAAIEQLKIWGERTSSPVAARQIGADAAGLVFDAFRQAVDEGRDVMLVDTAGRLQNKTELMAELEKIIRVLKKRDPSAPHTVLLTLDATTGQNALSQVEIFRQVAGVNGLVMTKLDGTARGGILVAIAARFKLPVFFIGVGEKVGDLEPFEADEFARSIAGLERADEEAA